MPPARTPKCMWPVRTNRQRRDLALQGAEHRSPSTSRSILVPPGLVREHSQLVIRSVGCQVGIRLVASARTRLFDRDFEQERNLKVVVEAAGVAVPADENPHCQLCGLRRKLIFIGGKRSRAPCPCLIAERRRLCYKQTDAHGLFDPLLKPYDRTDAIDERDAEGHLLFVVDEMAFCWLCGAFVTEGVHRLRVECRGTPREGQGY